jgi:hypothetical protein
MSMMNSSVGGVTASAHVARRPCGHGWKLSGEIEISSGAGRVMYIGSRAIWRDGIEHTVTVWPAPGGGVSTDSKPPSMCGRRLKRTVMVPSLMAGRWLRAIWWGCSLSVCAFTSARTTHHTH